MAIDKKKFEKFYGENMDKIYRFVFFRIGGDKELAQDLVSEIFIKAMNNFESFDEKISKSAWLFTIARNHLANYWRDHKPISPLPIDGEENTEAIWLTTAITEFKGRQNNRALYELLDKLEAEEREIVTFHYIFGYSYAEIAQMKNSSEGAVKVAAHRAIKKMREHI